nr:Uncharacterised protein [Klebsiella pneumoniae]
MMPLLGSDERMRGYYRGRYRDKTSSAVSWNIAGSSPAARDCRLGRGGNHGALTVVAE